MKSTALKLIAVSAVAGFASFGALAHEDYSEGGSLHWLEHNVGDAVAAADPADAGRIERVASAEAVHELSDGSTLYVFRDGRMGMEDRTGRSLTMKDGHPMQTKDGETVVMKGNEVWRVERLHGLHRGG